MSRKGFTLIELLAVIVILAVISLIATPIIMKSINDAKKGAAKDSGYGYINTVEYYVVQSHNDDTIDDVELNGLFDYDNLKTFINAKGTLPTEVNVNLIEGRVDNGTIIIDGFTLTIVDRIIIDVAANNSAVQYLITVSGNVSCSVVDKSSAAEGEEVIVNTLQGYTILPPSVLAGENEIIVNYENMKGYYFSMPNADVDVNVTCFKVGK